MDTRPDGDFQSHCSLLFNFLPAPAGLELGVPLLSALAVWYLCALCAGHKILIIHSKNCGGQNQEELRVRGARDAAGEAP